MHRARQSYLFVPAEASALLRGVRRLVPPADLAHEGTPSTAFPRARKSERQFLRVIGGADYPHIQQLLGGFDYCSQRGFLPAKLLRTRARDQFISLVSECVAAEHLMRRGFAVEDVDRTKRGA